MQRILFGAMSETGFARATRKKAARPFLGSRAASGPDSEELRDSEWTYTSTHAYLSLGTAGRGTRKGTVGCQCERRGRRSCVTRNGHTDVDVTQPESQ